MFAKRTQQIIFLQCAIFRIAVLCYMIESSVNHKCFQNWKLCKADKKENQLINLLIKSNILTIDKEKYLLFSNIYSKVHFLDFVWD